MKEMSVKKIVLCSIAAISAVMLLIGLSFPVLSLSVGGVSVDAAGMGANGFDMLSFEFPTVMRALLMGFLKEEDFAGTEIILGVISLVTLVVAVAFLAFVIFALFRFTYKKTQTVILVYFIFATVIVLFNMIMALIDGANLNAIFEKKGVGELYKCKTSAYLSLIFLAVFFAAYLVCRRVIKEKLPKGSEDLQGEAGASERGARATIIEQLQQEVAMTGIIREYKALLDEQVISAADYVYVKSKLLSPVSKRKGHGEGKEQLIIKLLKEYQRLYTDEIITSAEFIEKKGELVQL